MKGILTPVGTYERLTYQNFLLNETFSGVKPHSDPNVALAVAPPFSLDSGLYDDMILAP